MSFFQYLDREIEPKDVTDPSVKDKKLLKEMKISKLRCIVSIDSIWWVERISLGNILPMIEEAEEMDNWHFAESIGWNNTSTKKPYIGSIDFIVRDDDNIYYHYVVK